MSHVAADEVPLRVQKPGRAKKYLPERAPVLVKALEDRRVVEVQGGQHHTLARTQVRMHCIPFTFSHLPPLRPQSRSSLCNARMRVDIRRSRQSVQ